jgi:hypothetical protein
VGTRFLCREEKIKAFGKVLTAESFDGILKILDWLGSLK